jgi:NAD kinase
VSSAADSAKISYDGQQFHDIANGDVVEVRRFEHPAIFVWPERGMFLKKLKSKLLTE